MPGTIVSKEGGFLTSWRPDEFDAEFFGISPREAAAMDPQQRLLLEVTWEALENAGITAPMIRGTQTSVFVGMTTYDYTLTLAGRLPPEEVDPHVPFGNAANFAAGRLSYFLGAHGPAVVLDTACSSSLVTVHLACQSLRRRESDQALVAGVNLMLSPENSVATSRWGMLAPDGRCKTFDASADGYVRSEGCGVVVLKRLSDAVRDGDSVLAVVRGSAVNQDGPSSGQTVPSGPAQQAVLRAALAAARLEPSDIDYIEAHGTGTALGDPIELGALHQVFGERHGSAPLVLGLGQDQPRSPGVGRRHRRFHQDRSHRAARLHSAAPAFHPADAERRRGRVEIHHRCRRHGLARRTGGRVGPGCRPSGSAAPMRTSSSSKLRPDPRTLLRRNRNR